ncbi:MAG: hypothetical protein HY815_21675 [Candidatus Riflebacteria bacterium]|nr:hypothetical protein [Candidatus Riflebacteria bacterium]
MARFVLERFPPHLNGVFGVASFYSLYLLWQALAGVATLRVSPGSVVGAATVTGMLLLLRIMDEIKDHDTDRRLFPARPLAAGRVTLADLRAAAVAIVTALAVANLFLGWVFVPFLVLLGYSWLMFRWFFVPDRLSNSLVLAFLTHQPYVPLSLAYTACVAARDLEVASRDPRGALAIVGLWAPFAGWEVSRKIRAPGHETEYRTYSMVLGPRLAALLCLSLVAASAAALAVVARSIGASPALVGLAGLAYGVTGAALIAFVVGPSRARSNLEPYFDLLLLTVHVGLVVELAVRRSVAW